MKFVKRDEIITKGINACLNCGKKNLKVSHRKLCRQPQGHNTFTKGRCASNKCKKSPDSSTVFYVPFEEAIKIIKKHWNKINPKPEKEIAFYEKEIAKYNRRIIRLKKLFKIT